MKEDDGVANAFLDVGHLEAMNFHAALGYLREVLKQLLAHPSHCIDGLRPPRWVASCNALFGAMAGMYEGRAWRSCALYSR
ncbi:hypothetical protein [Aquabacterium sp.]|uniref:hypothetical protein n=1 Tax=Aquabacterium sp. TaxID=1872578 RepID=UPI003D6D1F2B